MGPPTMFGQTLGILETLWTQLTGVSIVFAVISLVVVNVSLGATNKLTEITPGTILKQKSHIVGIQQMVYKLCEAVQQDFLAGSTRCLVIPSLSIWLQALEFVIHFDVSWNFQWSPLNKRLDFLKVYFAPSSW